MTAAASAASAGSFPTPAIGEQRQPDADRRRLAAGDPVDAVHEIEQIDEPDPEQRRRGHVERRRAASPETPPLPAPARRCRERPRRTARRAGPPATNRADRRARRSQRAARPRRSRRAASPAPPPPRSAPSQAASDAATTAMPPPRGVGIACDERSFGRSSTDGPPQQRDQRARAETGGDAGGDHHDCGKYGAHLGPRSVVRTSSRRKPGSMLRPHERRHGGSRPAPG